MVPTSSNLTLPVRLGVPLAAGACLAWAFWPTLLDLERHWRNDEQYSHGYLVPAFAVFLLWSRRRLLKGVAPRPSWWGVALLAVSLALHLAGARLYVDYLEAIALVPVVAALFLLFGGWPVLSWAWPAVGFLAFMVPLPYFLEAKFADKLQTLGAQCSNYCLQTFGLPALVDGTTIWVGDQPLQVEKACSGLGMLLVFFALSSAVALLMKRPLLDKLVVLLSAIPIALLANVTRITATGLLYEVTNDPRVRTFIHDGAGWFMMIFALVVMLIELKLLSWLFVETDPAEQMPIGLHARALLPRANPGRAAPA